MNREAIRSLVEGLGGLLSALRAADPHDKTEVYRQLGLRVTFDHEKRVALTEVRPEPPEGIVFVGHRRKALYLQYG
ncbi:hypothetical protein [Streptomyces daliensis]|uniref:Uncharacterized protein n=1 Tax=Streptomyces daliensis TaxID=299421 RepID=A0A8T4INY0_9ACTN|nr:hypothetical protein [Streptomyces daliensis]